MALISRIRPALRWAGLPLWPAAQHGYSPDFFPGAQDRDGTWVDTGERGRDK